MSKQLSPRMQRIKDVVTAFPATCAEVEQVTGWSHQSVSAAITELVRRGDIRIITTTIPKGSNRSVRVYAGPQRVADQVTVDFTGTSQNFRIMIMNMIRDEKEGAA